MPLETAQYVSDLQPNNPATTDAASQGDDHIRLIKSALKNSFPNIDAPVASTPDEIDAVANTKQFNAQDGSAAAPSHGYAADATVGFYRSSTGHQTIVGRLLGNGAVPVGSLADFPKEPPNLAKNGVSGFHEWVECDGSQYNISDYPDLGAFLGNTFGGDGITTFCVPNLVDTGRYRRARSSTVAAGSYQTNTFKTHVHAIHEDLEGGHSHVITVSDPGHNHAVSPSNNELLNRSAGGSFGWNNANSGSGTLAVLTAQTGISSTASWQPGHVHNVAVNSDSDGGGDETRPETFVVVTCIKA